MRPLTIKKNYRLTPLSDLLTLITMHSDSDALQELLSNRKPYVVEGRRSDLPSFLREISSNDSSRTGRNQDLVDCAYNMTLDKFSHLPLSAQPDSAYRTGETDTPKRRVIDCCHYYKAVVVQFESWKEANPLAGTIDQELQGCNILQQTVFRNFHWSMQECRRSNMPFAKRYVWKVKDQTISLRRPVEIPGGAFRKWLEQNIADPDPKNPGEGERIQREVDRHFAQGSFVPWDEKTMAHISGGNQAADPGSTVGSKTEASRLAMTVAREKVANIDEMRPAIRELGKEKLFFLVLRIFSDIEDGIMEDVHVANDFGLSKATFSRFAGSDWTKHIGQDKFSIPDLWLNTAKVLASSPEFTEIVLSAGIVPRLKEVIKRGRNANV